jgi:PTH1 family peptidyl-tRNA hydrolase
MRLIVGLGNPGGSYQNTRHNAGFLVADALLKAKTSNDFTIRKSDTFMNDSGSFVKKLADQYKLAPESIYIAHDDLDIPIGSYKIQFGRGPKDHNGIKSVDESLGTDQYWHVRVGVDNRPLDNRPMGEEYVLQDFTDEEKQILERTIQEICKKLVTS